MIELSSELQADRRAFLDRVFDYTNGDRPHSYQKVIDDLIDWSLQRKGKLYHCRRSGTQDVVRFRVVGMDQVFWIAYPRLQKKDAKLIALEDEVSTNPPSVRKAVLQEFIAMRTPEVEEDEGYPTLSFLYLFWEPKRRKVLDLLDWALEEILKTRLQ